MIRVPLMALPFAVIADVLTVGDIALANLSRIHRKDFLNHFRYRAHRRTCATHSLTISFALDLVPGIVLRSDISDR